MRLLLIAGTVLLAHYAAAADEFDPELAGRWKLVAVERAGKELPREAVQSLPGVLVFEAGKIRGLVGDKQVYEADFIVNTKASPKSYEMRGGKDRKGKDIVTRGIYEIDAKGQLRKCFVSGPDAVAPKSFDTIKTPSAQLIVYERVK